MSIAIVPVIMAVASIYAAGTAIKALKDGDYLTAVIAGIGAYAGLSAVMAPAATVGTQAATTGATEVAATPMAAPTATVGTDLVGTFGTASPSLIAPAGTGAMAPSVFTGAQVGAPAGSSGILGGLGDAFSAAGKAVVNLADNIGIGEIVDGIKRVSTDIFQNMETGDLTDSLGNLLKKGSAASGLMGLAGNVMGPMINKSAQEDKMEKAEETEERALMAQARSDYYRNLVPANALPSGYVSKYRQMNPTPPPSPLTTFAS